MQSSEVVGAITEQWHTLLGQMGKRQLTQLSFWHRFSCLRIQYLWIEIVLIQMGSMLTLTLITHSRSCNLTQSVDVIRLDSQTCLQFSTHLLCPRLRTKGTKKQAPETLHLAYSDIKTARVVLKF